jgi:hypothetical protein
MKTCIRCKELKPLNLFGQNKSQKDELHCYCKNCHNNSARQYRSTLEGFQAARNAKHKNRSTPEGREKSRKASREACHAWRKNYPEKALAHANKRRAMKLQAIPKWFDKEKVDLVYAKAKEWDMHVDHVIPLQGKNVCGLHVWENLQLLDKSLNSIKGNQYYD